MTRAFPIVLAFVILLAPCIWPQASTSTVGGTVRDQSGAVIPGARVVLFNTATNVSTATQSNEAGFYLFPGVVSGAYRILAEVAGMEKYEGTLVVQAAQRVVVDPVLRPGQLTTAIQVGDVTPLVTADNPMLSPTLERARIEQLPMNGRTVTTLFQTVPGLEGTKGYRAYGARHGAQEFLLDGSAETDRRWGNPPGISNSPSIPPGLDSIQEFTVALNAISAKYSRPTSIILSTKNGTNQFHGDVFETNRNSGYGVARKREEFWQKAPYLNRNEYGASAGGPLVLPKLYDGRNRTFWFASWEACRIVQNSTNGWSVPTSAMWNGDFSNLRDSQGRLYTLYDPWSTGANGSRQPFSYGGKLNVIDPSRISALAKYLQTITPAANLDVNPLVAQNYWGPLRQTSNNWTFTARFDHRFTDRDQFYVRVNYTDLKYLRDVNAGSHFQMLDGMVGYDQNVNYPKSIAMSWVHTFSPTLFNELLVSGHREAWGGGPSNQGVNWQEKLGLPNPFSYTGFPAIVNIGLGPTSVSINTGSQVYTGTASLEYRTGSKQANNNTYFILDDNATKIAGRHELQFGFHARRDIMNMLMGQANDPTLSFNTSATALMDSTSTPQNPIATPYTGAAVANLMLGLANYSAALQHGWYYVRGGEYALYFQDNWKVTPRLTLNLGMRWEYWPAFHEKNSNFTGLDNSSHSIVTGMALDSMYKLGLTLPSIVDRYRQLGLNFVTASDVGLPSDLAYSNKKNFAPRLGFAYRALSGKRQFVVRGGYSLAYYPNPTYPWLDNNGLNPPESATFTWNPNNADQSPDGLPNYWLRATPVYVAGVNSTNAISLNSPQGISRGSAAVYYFAADRPDSRIHTWNLSLEKEIMAGTAVSARYVGTHNAHLDAWYSMNDSTPAYVWYMTKRQPMPTGEYASVATRPYDQRVLGTVYEYQKIASGNYNGVELELRRHFSKGYGFQLYYVMANALAMTNGDPLGTATYTATNQFMPGTVPEDDLARLKYLNYARDDSIPKHRLRWNWLADLPVGKGKAIGRNAGRLVDLFIGGWQIAGTGQIRSTYFNLPTSVWPTSDAKIEIFDYKYPIQDCRSGQCFPGYLWWNGYIPANQINSHDANGRPNGVMGVPENYKPAATPLIPWGTTTLPANAPAGTNVSSFWDTNTVWIPLDNGTVQRTTYSPGRNPWQNQRVRGPRQWTLDASLFKNFAVTERVGVRFMVDFFNVLNAPGNPNSIGSDGVLNTKTSGQSPRTLQLGLRATW